MNLSNNEIICLIIALYYYEQEYESQEDDDIVREVVDLRDKLEDYLLRTQTPEYAKASADFMKTLATNDGRRKKCISVLRRCCHV